MLLIERLDLRNIIEIDLPDEIHQFSSKVWSSKATLLACRLDFYFSSCFTNLLNAPTNTEVTVLPPSKSWESEIAELMATAKALRGGAGQSPLCSPAFSLVRASLELAELATSNSQDAATLLKTIEKCDRLLTQSETAIYRSLKF